MKYFVSLSSMASQASVFWRKYFTVGDIKVPEHSEEKGYVIISLENLEGTPLLCEVIRGFFSGMCQMIVGKKGTCEEVKHPLKDELYHEFLFKW